MFTNAPFMKIIVLLTFLELGPWFVHKNTNGNCFVNTFRNIFKTSLLQIMKYLQNIVVTNHDFDFRSKTDHIGRYTISCPAWWLPSSSTYPGQMLPLVWGMSSWERCTSTIWGVSYPVYGLKGIPNLSQEIVWLILNIECLLLAILIIHFRDTNSSWQHLSVYTL